MSAGWRELRGSRILFPLALAFGALWIPIWLFRYYGALSDSAVLPGAVWHGHELIYGYLGAVVAGFLTVADRGWRVVLLVTLWALARVLLLLDVSPALAASVDLAFLPLLLVMRRPPIWSGAKFMSLGIAAVAAALALANAWIHLAAASGDATRALRTSAMVVVLLLVVVPGRLIPGHTRAARRRGPGLALVRTEQASLAIAAALALSEALGSSIGSGVFATLLGAVQIFRLFRWWGARRPE